MTSNRRTEIRQNLKRFEGLGKISYFSALSEAATDIAWLLAELSRVQQERDELQQEIATLRQQIAYIPEVFARAERTGPSEDVPEGVRTITFSDTLALQIESTLRRALLQKGQ